MGNKTIYVGDEKLWKEAKKLAGDKGLSGIIADGLRQFVEQRKQESKGVEEFRFPAGFGGGDRIAFRGKAITSRKSTADMADEVWPQEAFEDNDQIRTSFEVFRTLKGTLIVTAALVREADDETIPVYWATHPSVLSLRDDKAIKTMNAHDRAELLDDVSGAIKEDWATRID